MILSYQLYSSRNFPPLDETMRRVADAGLGHVEGFGALLENADTLEAALRGAGLSMPTAHIGLDVLERNPALAVALAKRFGLEAVFVPYLGPDDRPSDVAGWAAFATRVTAAGEPLRAAGIGFGWHNHDFEFAPMPCGTLPIDAMLGAAPSLMLELDLGWVCRAGHNPLAWIAKYEDRILAAHIKDVATSGQNADEDGWADVGAGIMDWRAIVVALRAAGVRHLVLEHDNPSDDGRFMRNSVAAIGALNAEAPGQARGG